MKLAAVTGWVEEHPTERRARRSLPRLPPRRECSRQRRGRDGGCSVQPQPRPSQAQQAVVGGQIQMATIQTAGATAQNAANANAAVAINKAQTGAAVKINQQNATTASALGNDSLLATQSSNAAAVATTISNNNAATTMDASNNQTTLMQTFLGTTLPTELNLAHGWAAITVPGLFQGVAETAASEPANINALIAEGYTPAQADAIGGFH